MLHLSDNSTYIPFGEENHDPLHKVRYLVDLLEEKFRCTVNAAKDLSLDEATCAFKGRVKFKVYNKDKPKKWGIKIFEICESDSGYCLTFSIFAGEEKAAKEKTYHLVMDLMKNYLDKGHTLYMDRWYNGVKLFEELTKRKTAVTGTINFS